MQVAVKGLDLSMVSIGFLGYVYDDAFRYRHNEYFCSDMLVELARREKLAGIKPDEDLDIFMKVLHLLGVGLFSIFFNSFFGSIVYY